MESVSVPACYRFIVNGRVQGVFFRQSSKQCADTLGLTGWVRNRQDGSVEGLACGTSEALESFRQWLDEGPPAARVDRVDWQPQTWCPARGFEVRR